MHRDSDTAVHAAPVHVADITIRLLLLLVLVVLVVRP